MIHLSHHDTVDNWGNVWGVQIDAWDDDIRVGYAAFGLDGRKTLRPRNVEVLPGFRRQGIATMMYAYAEKLTDRKIKKSHDLTDDGKAFWRGNTYPKQFGGDLLDMKKRLKQKAAEQKQRSREKVEQVFEEALDVMSQDPGFVEAAREREIEMKEARLKQGGQKFRVRQIVHFFDRERIPWDGIVLSANYRDYDIDGPGWYYDIKWINTERGETHAGYNHQDDLTP